MEETKNVQEDQKTNVVSAADGVPVVTVIDTDNSGKGRYSWLKKGDVYEFTTTDESLDTGFKAPMMSMIIGEVDSVRNNIVKLAAWAYTSEPEKVRPESEIVVVSCNDIVIKDWYKFMNARMKKVSVTSLVKGNEEDSEEYDLLEHNFAQHLVEDASSGRISIVKHDEKLYVMPTPEQAVFEEFGGRKPDLVVKYSVDERIKTAFCEITDIVKKNNLEAIFGHDVVLDVESYEEIVFTISYNAVDEKADNGDTNNTIHDFDGLNPHLFMNAIEAADTIERDDDSQYIIVVPMSADKAEVTLTDDPHSILHSRHLIGKEVIVYGPVKNNYFSNISDTFRHYTLV